MLSAVRRHIQPSARAPTVQIKRYMPTLLLLIVLACAVSFSLLYLFHHGLGRFLRLAGYVFLATSFLSFLFFLSIDPGYGWISSPDLQKNHMALSIFIILFILSIGLILLGRQMSTPGPAADGGTEQAGRSIPAR